MRIGEVFDRIYDEEVGWRPVTGTVKPVHVANGMFRAITGRRHDIDRIISFIVWWRKKNEKLPHEERSFEKLVTEQPEGPFACFREDPRRFDRARDFVRAVLGADAAVFPDARYSSLTLTCREMISSDPNDHGLGLFAAALVQGSAGDGPLAVVVRGALETEEPDDPVTTLVWPLLLDRSGRVVAADPPSALAHLEAHCQEYLNQLRSAAEDLASHERNQGNRLRTLQRAVHFACISTQSHVQALAVAGQLADRVPALVSAREAKGSAVTNASEATLGLIYDRFEAWLRDRLALRLAEGAPLHQAEAISIANVRGGHLSEILSGIAPQHPGPLTDRDLQLRRDDLEEAKRLFGGDVARTLAHALWSAYRREYSSGGPREYLARIGRWTGLIYPHFQGRTREKRFRPSVLLLDMMVRACVPMGQTIALERFLERMWLRFGLIVGGRGDGQEDAALLRRHGIDMDATLLVSNTEDFVDQLVALGLARRFADNVTFVGDGHAE